MLRVFVVAEDPVLRSLLTETLAGYPECAVVGEGEIDEVSAEITADVIVWDIGRDPADVRRQITGFPAGDVPFLMIGPGSGMAEAIAAGARGYLVAEPDGARLVAALHAVAHGLQVTEVPAAPSAPDASETGELTAGEELTAREREVLQLLAEGLANKEVARQLRISEHTVKFHVNAILGKLGARTRGEAIAQAARLGLLLL